ncbi:hypothetical protein WMY93_020604 [Mugilogobius chulae]|uniref:Uncharacterized protein n=1 Tax=Mugilogobius chulae TaxID=88201 RepID=A0AAW0NIE3_9GOBI
MSSSVCASYFLLLSTSLTSEHQGRSSMNLPHVKVVSMTTATMKTTTLLCGIFIFFFLETRSESATSENSSSDHKASPDATVKTPTFDFKPSSSSNTTVPGTEKPTNLDTTSIPSEAKVYFTPTEISASVEYLSYYSDSNNEEQGDAKNRSVSECSWIIDKLSRKQNNNYKYYRASKGRTRRIVDKFNDRNEEISRYE